RCCRRRCRTRQSLRPAASNQRGDRLGSHYFNRHGRCPYFRFGERRPASGAQGAATEMQRYFQKQAERLFPVVEVESGKNVTMVMLSGTKVPGLEAMNRTDPRRGLD